MHGRTACLCAAPAEPSDRAATRECPAEAPLLGYAAARGRCDGGSLPLSSSAGQAHEGVRAAEAAGRSRRRWRWQTRGVKPAMGTHVVHELLADRPDLLAQRRAEHHDLLVVRRRFEDVLDVASHVCIQQATIPRDRLDVLEACRSSSILHTLFQTSRTEQSRAADGANALCAPILSSILSHSSRMKCRTPLSFRAPSFASYAQCRPVEAG